MKTKLSKFSQLIDSISYGDEKNQISSDQNKELNVLLMEMCSKKTKINIIVKSRKKCMFCKQKLPLRNDVDPSCLVLSHCSCLQTVHKACLVKACLKISENTLDERIEGIRCLTCNWPVTHDLIEEAFGEEQVRKIRQEVQRISFMEIHQNLQKLDQERNEVEKRKHQEELERKRKEELERQREQERRDLERKKEEDRINKEKRAAEESLNLIYILKLQEEEKMEILTRERNATFDCQICAETKKIEADCITLDCDHRFCRECLRNDIKTKMADNRVKSKDIVCFTCKTPIDYFMIQNVLNYEESKAFDRQYLAFNPSEFLKKDEVCVKCPRGKCPNFVILNKQFNVTHHTCEVCRLLFCVRGCPKPHEGKTCEQQRMAEVNVRNDQLFEDLARNQNLKRCQACTATVERNGGCNHMTCRCGYQFCYVCAAKWHSCGH